MTRRASLSIGFLGLLLGLIAFLLADRSPLDLVEAVPLPPAVFHGTVSVGGEPATDGVSIEAKIGGVNYAFSPTGDGSARTSGGTYGRGTNVFQVLADDTDTLAKEGGVAGETVVFFLGGSTEVAGLGTFKGGSVTELNLSIVGAGLLSIAVTPLTPSIPVGRTQQFTAIGTPTQDLTALATWASTNPAVATVNSSGLATAVGEGTAQIIATFQGVAGQTTLTVTSAVIDSIAVVPSSPSIAKGLTQQFTANATLSDGSIQDVTAAAAWTSSTTSVATIDGNGLAIGLNEGATTITATLTAVSGSTVLTVTAIALSSIDVTPALASISVAQTQQFVATGTFTDSSTQVLTLTATWTSSNTGVATIDPNGLATGVSSGPTTITATVGTTSGSATLLVDVNITSVSVTPSAVSIALGLTQQFIATATFTDGSQQPVAASWESSTTTVATVDSSGLATSVGQGGTTIKATIQDPGTLQFFIDTAQLTVTAPDLVSVVINPPTASVAVGADVIFSATGNLTDGSSGPLTSVTWTSSNTTIATVAGTGFDGLATGVSAGGPVTITATAQNAAGQDVSGTAQLTVTFTLAVTPTTASISVGGLQQFTATATFSASDVQDVTEAATWGSTDTAIAGVSDTAESKGLATGVAAGSTTITSTYLGIAATADLTVTAGVVFFPPPPPPPEEEPPPPGAPPPPAAVPPTVEDILELSPEEVDAVFEALPPEDAAILIGQLSTGAATAILEELSSDVAAALIEVLDTNTAVEIFGEVDAATGASIFENVSAEKASEITELLTRGKAADVLEQVSAAKAARIVEGVTDDTAAEIVIEMTSSSAAGMISQVERKKAGRIFDRLTVDKAEDIVNQMSEESLLDRIPEMSPAAQFALTERVLARLRNAPVEHLVPENAPTVDPDLPDPVPFVDLAAGRSIYSIARMKRGSWGKIVGSPAPIERILARANNDKEDISVTVQDLIAKPAGLPDLPSDLIVNEFFNVSLGNVEPEDVAMAHVTVFIEQSWIEANNIHKWSLEFNRFDEEFNDWVPFPTKRVREDAQQIFYTMIVPGFSTVAITGRPDRGLPPQVFNVSGLTISPAQPRDGDDVIVQAQVTNSSSGRRLYPATLWVNDTIDETILIAVGAGQTESIRFSKPRSQGQYKIRVDRLLANLTVGAAPTPTPPPTPTPVPGTPTVGPSPTPTSVPTATVPPTATLPPTSTPTPVPTREGQPPTLVPTATPAPTEIPTATPVPTSTPSPAATSTATPSAADVESVPLDEAVQIVESLPFEQAVEIIRQLSPEKAAEILGELNPDLAARILEALAVVRAAGLVELVEPATASDILSQVDPTRRDEILDALDADVAAAIRALLAGPTPTPTPEAIPTPGGGFPIIIVILLVVVLLGGGGAAAFVFLRKQSGPPTGPPASEPAGPPKGPPASEPAG